MATGQVRRNGEGELPRKDGSGLDWGVKAGVNGERWSWHVACRKDASRVQLFKERKVGELLVLRARIADQATLELVERTDEFDEDHFAEALLEGLDGIRYEFWPNRGLGSEGEDKAGNLGVACGSKD